MSLSKAVRMPKISLTLAATAAALTAGVLAAAPANAAPANPAAAPGVQLAASVTPLASSSAQPRLEKRWGRRCENRGRYRDSRGWHDGFGYWDGGHRWHDGDCDR